MQFVTTTRFGGLYRRVDNQSCVAGHARLFGLFFYFYNQINKDWSLRRVWNFGLFAIHHVGEGKEVDPPGWYVTFAKLSFAKIHHGFSIRWDWANTYRVSKVQ